MSEGLVAGSGQGQEVRVGQGLAVDGLTVKYHGDGSDVAAVTDLSFRLGEAESLGLVGESGSGKSVTALSIMRLIVPPGEVSGVINWRGRDLLRLNARDVEAIRGREIAMVFQDPLAYLNPVMKVGQQVSEVLQIHMGMSHAAARKRTKDLFGLVGLPRPGDRLDDYPHQLSGGMRQRVLIAIAISCEPRLLIADEPTTALDVTIQAGILRLLSRLQRELKMASILITHDLAVIAGLVDRVAVMYAGRLVETGSTEEIFSRPRHPYTDALLESLPRVDEAVGGRLRSIKGSPPDARQLPTGCAFHPRCEYALTKCSTDRPELRPANPGHTFACWVDIPVRPSDGPLRAEIPATVSALRGKPATDEPILKVVDLKVVYRTGGALGWRRSVRAVDGVSFDVRRGETLGLVGESGSGKSTVAQSILHLTKPTAGTVIFDGHDTMQISGRMFRALRRDFQIVFQDPYSSLNPRQTVGRILAEPLIVHGIDRQSRGTRIGEIVDLVGLSRGALGLYPHQFSGGQRQRIAIARALVLKPKLLVCDEPVSALDVSVRAQVLNLLRDLQHRMQFTSLFISHDLGVVRQVCDRVLVMYRGVIVEAGSSERVFNHPLHPYTQELLAAIPVPDPQRQRARFLSAPAIEATETTGTKGCRFADRCLYARELCREEEPALIKVANGASVACHFWDALGDPRRTAAAHPANSVGSSRP
jgi:oligopeptide/dipeptide ABC transporter ATP-binding protein